MIPAFVLILSMVSDGVSVTYIPFATREACVAAGELWMKKTYPNIDRYNFRIPMPNYICVSTQ